MLEIVPGSYLTVTPYGAWRAVARSRSEGMDRGILLGVLQEAMSPLLSLEALRAWTPAKRRATRPSTRCSSLQEEACLEAWPSPRMAPIGTLESTLPGLLAALSDTGQAVLADRMGFCLAIAGYPSDTGEALAALGADILSVAERQAAGLVTPGRPPPGWLGQRGRGRHQRPELLADTYRPDTPCPHGERATTLQPARLRRARMGALCPATAKFDFACNFAALTNPHLRDTGRAPCTGAHPGADSDRRRQTSHRPRDHHQRCSRRSRSCSANSARTSLSRESTAECSKKSPSFAAWARENCSAAAAVIALNGIQLAQRAVLGQTQTKHGLRPRPYFPRGSHCQALSVSPP
jgi:hypothetical protein